MLGIYEDERLVKSFQSEEKASEFLPVILEQVLKDYEPKRLIYANGPGSFMGIKISYIAFKTLSISKNIPLFALSGFELNHRQPIAATSGLCFVMQKDGRIGLERTRAGEFFLPQSLEGLNLSEDNLPFYFLDAI